MVIVLRMLAKKKNRHINAQNVEMVGNKRMARWQNDRCRNEILCINRNFGFVHFNDCLRQKNVGWRYHEQPTTNETTIYTKIFCEVEKKSS